MNVVKSINAVLSFLSLMILATHLVYASPKLQKPKTYNGKQDITGWLMSEKLDGIRAYWDGKKLMTRKGKQIHAPEWFVQNLPPFELDGELWSKQGELEWIQSVVMDKKPSEDWKKLTYNLFEVPNAKGDFKARLKKAADWFRNHPHKYVKIIPQILCDGKDHLEKFLKEVESKGGEGVVVKDPNQLYKTGRSSHVLKVKSIRDMEAEVIAVHPGKGKYKNMMGSLGVRLKNGIAFKIGTGFKKKDRINPPKVGDMVTFKYQGFTKKGKPRYASFMHVRKD